MEKRPGNSEKIEHQEDLRRIDEIQKQIIEDICGEVSGGEESSVLCDKVEVKDNCSDELHNDGEEERFGKHQ